MSIKTGCEYVGYIDPWTDEERLSDEEIVRCRDCKSSKQTAYGMMCHHFSMSSGAGWPVEPDGFCAWGERKDA
jgi:hypothetical protein